MEAASVAPPGLGVFLSIHSWGSRPRLPIFRSSAARTERRSDSRAGLGLAAAERRRRKPSVRPTARTERRKKSIARPEVYAAKRRRRDVFMVRGPRVQPQGKSWRKAPETRTSGSAFDSNGEPRVISIGLDDD
jgi:hypothetical protein